VNNYKRSEYDAEKNEKMLQNYLATLERKRNEFNNFMELKGKEALAHVKRNQELKLQMKEEITRIEAKKKVKSEEIQKAHQVAQNYREANEKQDESVFQEPGIFYKVNQAFHNMGNKVDYSTTRFHNIMVIRHEDDVTQEFISAHEKAEQEIEKKEERQRSKNQVINDFNNQTKINSVQLMRKEKAKENLKKLEVELDRIKEARKKSKNKATM
jgi:hypothetical protein